ncbi:MAG: hypothetical protein DRQ47_03270 [Gammaproteobacteria bacterium]|nr:MAG: hypothetical protein DRQ47_03270 [Gammaproteobacteria bacterium]
MKIHLKRLFTLVSVVVLATILTSQIFAQTGMPVTDIAMLEINADFSPNKASFIPLTERKGYDNQPHFAKNNLLYWTRHSDGQTDIWQMNLDSQNQSALTKTAESEYSPTLMPGAKRFSVIQVEGDGTQRLWSFDLTGKSPKLVLEDIKPVGYHVWLDADTLGLFILGEQGMTLQLAKVSEGIARVLDIHIGRSLHKVPGKKAFSYTVHNESHNEKKNEIRVYNLVTESSSFLATPRKDAQDYLWLSDGSILMGQGNTIYRWKDGNWAVWAEFPALGEISRLALSPDGNKLALVHGPVTK